MFKGFVNGYEVDGATALFCLAMASGLNENLQLGAGRDAVRSPASL